MDRVAVAYAALIHYSFVPSRCKTRSSATVDKARDADDVDFSVDDHSWTLKVIQSTRHI